MYVLDAFGDIYACWERTGDPSMRIGTITGDGDVLVSASVMATVPLVSGVASMTVTGFAAGVLVGGHGFHMNRRVGIGSGGFAGFTLCF